MNHSLSVLELCSCFYGHAQSLKSFLEQFMNSWRTSWLIQENVKVLKMFINCHHEWFKNSWRIFQVLEMFVSSLQFWFKNSWRICQVLEMFMNWLQYWFKNNRKVCWVLKGAWIDFNTGLRTVEELDLNLKYTKVVNSSIKHRNSSTRSE